MSREYLTWKSPLTSRQAETFLMTKGFVAAELCETFAVSVALRGRDGGATAELGDDCGHALRASGGGGDKPHVLSAMQVRRLVCEECEFLQGFPRNYTRIPWRGKPAELCPDGPRYKALGNSMAVPCMRWIGRRIEAVEKILSKQPIVAGLMAAEGGL